jgi:hypothetical protein
MHENSQPTVLLPQIQGVYTPNRERFRFFNIANEIVHIIAFPGEKFSYCVPVKCVKTQFCHRIAVPNLRHHFGERTVSEWLSTCDVIQRVPFSCKIE